MKREIKTSVAIGSACIAMLIGLTIGTRTTRSIQINGQLANWKVDAIWSLVEKHYVDRVDVDTVADKLYEAMLSALDPHSRYFSAEAIAKENDALQGHFDGIGVVIRMREDTVCAHQIIEGGPSATAGVLPGDRILKVDSTVISGVGMSIDEAISHLRGPQGSTAKLKVKRATEEGVRTIAVRRGVISTPSLIYSGMLDQTTGYIRLNRFAETTYDEFAAATKRLKKQGMKQMILDLRSNGGGVMSSATDICDELLPGRELIVYTEGSHEKRREVRSRKGGLFTEGHLVVMIDEFSASASEIVAGAIQDNDRGIIVGRRSFGKGLVQQPFNLPDGSAVWLTVSRYYTPSGRCIQRSYDKGTDEYYADFIEQVNQEYLQDSVFSKITDSTEYYTAGGRVVYGGGGILPDYHINYKTAERVAFYNQLIGKGILDRYAFDIVSENGIELKRQYPEAKDFVSKFQVSKTQWQTIMNRAKEASIAIDEEGAARYEEEIKNNLKANIADMLYSTEAYYEVQLHYDPDLKEAITILKEKSLK